MTSSIHVQVLFTFLVFKEAFEPEEGGPRTAWCKMNSVSQAEVSTSTDVSRGYYYIKNYYSQRDKVI